MNSPPYWEAEVLTHELRSPDVAVFTCRPGRTLPFRAGQHVSVECPFRPRNWRAYSMANAPRRDGTLEFHVRADSHRGVSAALVGRLRPGDILRLAAPAGSLTLDRWSRHDLVFVTEGTGLAPAKALIDELIRYNRTRWIHLFRGERRRADFYDRAQLDRLAERHPWLTIVRATSDEPDEHGRQAPVSEVVAQHGPWTDHDFYVCGSAAMVGATRRRLARLGVPAARIQSDLVGDHEPCTASSAPW